MSERRSASTAFIMALAAAGRNLSLKAGRMLKLAGSAMPRVFSDKVNNNCHLCWESRLHVLGWLDCMHHIVIVRTENTGAAGHVRPARS